MLNFLKNITKLPCSIPSSKPYVFFRVLFESLDQTAAFYIDRARKDRLKNRQTEELGEDLDYKINAVEDIKQTLDIEGKSQLDEYHQKLSLMAEKAKGA